MFLPAGGYPNSLLCFLLFVWIIERLWDKRVVPENEFEESEDEETNALHGVRYAKSLRHGRVSKGNNQEQQPRTRGTVDSLPAAATKLSHPSTAAASGASSNGEHLQNGIAANGPIKAAEEVETDGDVVMDSGSTSSAAAVPSTAATSAKDTEMAEAP